jgi:hypothetical protein
MEKVMNKTVLLALLATLTSAYATEDFGGVKFHTSVEKHQVESLKVDLKYLYQTPIQNTDKDFLTIGEVAVGDGPNMHNWLLNRVKYIVGEGFKLSTNNIVTAPGKFPNTPMADKPDSKSNPKKDDENPQIVTIMTNLGGGLYLFGKEQKTYIGIKFDNEKVFAKSPRTGILQVGEGLFLKQFLVNKDPNSAANSIFRLATLFHEARHSDGNSKHTGFPHMKCPVGHKMAGSFACETSGNGSYSIGALSERHLIQNCKTCTSTEKTALSAGVADSFFRIIDEPKQYKLASIQGQVDRYASIIQSYESMKTLKSSANEQKQYNSEIEKLKETIKFLKSQNNFKMASAPKRVFLDPKPEGDFRPVTLIESKKAMDSSLK